MVCDVAVVVSGVAGSCFFFFSLAQAGREVLQKAAQREEWLLMATALFDCHPLNLRDSIPLPAVFVFSACVFILADAQSVKRTCTSIYKKTRVVFTHIIYIRSYICIKYGQRYKRPFRQCFEDRTVFPLAFRVVFNRRLLFFFCYSASAVPGTVGIRMFSSAAVVVVCKCVCVFFSVFVWFRSSILRLSPIHRSFCTFVTPNALLDKP